MEMRVLGRTGVRVSPLCLGAMMFGAWGNPDHDESVLIIHKALEAGINFIDTADVYSGGESEEIVGKALAARRRDTVVLATKAHARMGDDVNAQGNSRRWVISECESSLRRLGTDYIDLYQIHRPDPAADIDETLGALTDLIRAGKVRYAGSSTFPPAQIVEAQWTAQRRGRERFVCEQPPYSILVRGVEAEVLPVCQQYGMGVIPWSPLASGFLAGKYKRGEPGEGRLETMSSTGNPAFEKRTDRNWPILDVLLEAAKEIGRPPAEVALNWVATQRGVSSTIIGATRMSQLESNLRALDFTIPAEVRARLDEASRLERAHPYVMFDSAPFPEMINGGVPVRGWGA